MRTVRSCEACGSMRRPQVRESKAVTLFGHTMTRRRLACLDCNARVWTLEILEEPLIDLFVDRMELEEADVDDNF